MHKPTFLTDREITMISTVKLTNTAGPARLAQRRHAALSIVMLAVGVLASPAIAQNVFDDFSSGNDNAWTHVDRPLQQFGIASSYTVVGGQYQIYRPALATNSLAPTLSLRSDAVSLNSVISVDIVGWSTGVPLDASIVSRASLSPSGSPAGSYQMYGLGFIPQSVDHPGMSNLSFYRWNANGQLSIIGGDSPFQLATLGQSYRMVMTTAGNTFTGELFNITGGTPVSVASVSYTDTTAFAVTAPGAAGLLVRPLSRTNPQGAVSATFDNFRVVPAPGAAAMLGIGGLFYVRRQRR